jgi:hypothetical protein
LNGSLKADLVVSFSDELFSNNERAVLRVELFYKTNGTNMRESERNTGPHEEAKLGRFAEKVARFSFKE